MINKLNPQIVKMGSMKDQVDNLDKEMKTIRITVKNTKYENHSNRGKEGLQ